MRFGAIENVKHKHIECTHKEILYIVVEISHPLQLLVQFAYQLLTLSIGLSD